MDGEGEHAGRHACRRRAAAAGRYAGGIVTLEAIPAVVHAAGSAGGLEVDFLEAVLSDVGDEQVAGAAIEREAPRIAQSEVPDFLCGGHAARERIARRDGVRRA